MIDWQQQIVLVSPFFYPELISTGKANQHLAEAFTREGHGVAVICSHPLYPSWLPVHSRAEIDGIEILRGGAWIRYPKAMPLRRLVLEGWFALYATRRMLRLRKHADVIVSILPPSLFAYFLQLLSPRHIRRVAVVHDLQGVLAAQRQSLLRRAIIRLIHAVESRAFRSQDLCIFFSGDMANVAQQSYRLDPAKVAVQYPFITLPKKLSVPDYPGNKKRLIEIFPPDKSHVVYSGALGYKQNSQQLVSFMQAAAERYPNVQFHVLSGGPFFDELSAQYCQLPSPRVQFHPLVAEGDLEELYARSDIQIIPQAEGTEAAALPSKLPNLLAAGVHLLAICRQDSEVGRLIQQAGTGTIVDRWNQELFLRKLDEALAVVQFESVSVRRQRVESLLDLFSVTNIVRLTLGETREPKMQQQRQLDQCRSLRPPRAERALSELIGAAMNARTCVIFGGTGCIGTHFAKHLLEYKQIEHIYLADILPLRNEAYVEPLRCVMQAENGTSARVSYIQCDVRQPLETAELPKHTDLIVNLAAVHREPGHEPREYYHTNLSGAEHVCAYATRSGCRQIIFTSSIAPYGSSDVARDEESLPIPETAYGGSKLVAEKIHIAWQQAQADRRLIVLRPGVVFGPGEHANVARLARSLARGYFVYMGNRETRKAGVYVKELCYVLQFALEYQERTGQPMLLWNVSMDPPPKLEEFVNAICSSTGFAKPKFSVPRNLLVVASYPVAGIAQLFGVCSSVNPVRMRKLSQPTHIEPQRLRKAGYRFRYTMEQAMSDWKKDAPEDFGS